MSDNMIVVPAFESSIYVQQDPVKESEKRLQESIDSHSKTLQAFSEAVNKFTELAVRYADLLARFNDRTWTQHRALLKIQDLARAGRVDEILATATRALDHNAEPLAPNPQQS